MKLSATATFVARNDIGQFIASRVTPALVDKGDRAGAVVKAAAQAICPVLTGAARDSIDYRVDVIGSRVITTIYMGVDYAGYLEFGTGARGAASPGAGPYPYKAQWPGMAAHPTMRPALDESREQIRGLYTEPLLTA